MPRLALLTAVLACALSSLAATDAQAQTSAAGDPVALARTLAERYWGSTPCGGQVTILAMRPLAAGLEASTDGWVTFESSLGQNDLEAPASTYTGCTVSLASWQWPTRASILGDWNMFCLTVIHEMGHLLGHPHSTVPGSVMAPIFTSEANVPQICRSNNPASARSARRSAPAAASRRAHLRPRR